MSYAASPGYVKGSHKVICDVCGFLFLRSQTRMRWDNKLVCHDDWEARHPQDLIKAVTDNQAVNDPRPEGDTEYVEICLVWDLDEGENQQAFWDGGDICWIS